MVPEAQFDIQPLNSLLYMKRYKARMTPEQRRECYRKQNKRRKERIASMSTEERKAYDEKAKKYQKEYRRNITDEGRLETNRKLRDACKNRTPEQQETHNKTVRERLRRIRANWTHEERELAKAKRGSMIYETVGCRSCSSFLSGEIFGCSWE